MGWLTRLLGIEKSARPANGTKKSRGRPRGQSGRRKSSAELLDAELQRHIRNLKANDPTAYRRAMDQLFEEKYKVVLSSNGNGKTELLENIMLGVAGFGKMIKAQSAPDQTPQPVIIAPAPPQQPLALAPAAIEAPIEPLSTVPAPPAIQAGETASAYLIRNLDGKTPAEAAAWVRGQPTLAEFVAVMQATPEAAEIMTLKVIRVKAPEIETAIDWLLARETWTKQTLKILKGPAI